MRQRRQLRQGGQRIGLGLPGQLFERHATQLCQLLRNARQLGRFVARAFASCALLTWRDGGARALYERLFERVGFRPGLSHGERWRYEEANRMAKGYCRRLLELITARRMDQLLAELRETYRMGAEAKLQRLSAP